MITYPHSVRGWSMAICAILSLTLCHARATAQDTTTDTLSLTISQTDRLFLDKNLQLLAQHYNIEASKALVQQARLWDDPTLTTDQNVYANDKWFEHGTNPDGSPKGQYFIQLQQLIKTAGKRGKQIAMAQTNTQISEWQFTELMQQLKFQLHADLYTTARLIALRELYQEQNSQLEELRTGMQAQFNSGNIARKDLLRVQALQIGLQQEMTANLKELEDNQSELKTLLQITGNVFIRPVVAAGGVPSLATGIAALIDTARQNNASYNLETLQVQLQQQNLAYQKALAVPDITVAPSYDLNSNYAPRYVGLGLSLPLPVFNGNRGNIKAARWQVKQEEVNRSQADIRLQNDVTGAYKKYQYTLQLSSGNQQDFYSDYHKLQENIAESFRQRQISLLEFIDYFNDYKDIQAKLLQQQLDLQLAREELNLQTGADLFK